MAALEISTADAFHFFNFGSTILNERARKLTFFEMRYYLELVVALSESFDVGRPGVPETHNTAKPCKCSMNQITHQDGWRRAFELTSGRHL
jgi:hypothetical protein